MSDAQLAKHLGQLVKEVQHRMEAGRGSRPQLQAAAQQARSTLDRLVPRPAKQAKGSRSSKTSPVLQEGQRKAVQAALLAGVAPAQVAKHFGMSLAAVRKTLDETA